MNSVLSKRMINDKKSIFSLNDLQKSIKNQIENKIQSGRYVFEQISCPICGGIHFDQISEKDRYGLFMPTAICETCGLVLTNPRMLKENYSEFYNEEYRKLYGGIELPNDVFFQKQYDRGFHITKILECSIPN